MKICDVNVDLEELKKFKKQNAKERLEFIEFWAEYIKTHSDKEWSMQQNKLINSQLRSARQMKRVKGIAEESEVSGGEGD